MTDIVVSGQPRPRLDGSCFFCHEPLGVFGANVRSSTTDGIVGYACGPCVEGNRGVAEANTPVAVRDLAPRTQGECMRCRRLRVLVASVTFDDGIVEEVCGGCLQAVS